ncbi:MAG: AAA family ATPase [Gammaproteobacteria bacterium]|nr:AAA family ATPase [Gammaproteobacteria bacterium]NND59674.1 AAA family ATPase [Gammaproteobacteria bacterium]
MFLKYLRLQNVRCFKDIELDFTQATTRSRGSNRKWTIILGENGTGKSTLLRAAALATCGSEAVAEVIGNPRGWVRRGTRRAVLAATLQTKAGEDRDIELVINKGDSLSQVITRASKGLDLLDDALEHADRNYFVAGYGPSRRYSDAVLGTEGSRFHSARAQNVATLFDRDAELNPLEAWAMTLDYEQGEEGVAIVQKALSAFLPGLRFDHIDRKRRTLMFRTPDGVIPLSYLSDGYQNVACWVGDMLYRVYQTFDDYSEPLRTRGLLIVDEIDLHLHPIWQRRLHDFLNTKLPNMQLLVTTHSAVTAQQSGPFEIHYLKRQGKAVGLERFEPDPGSLLISQLLMTEAFGLSTDESKGLEDKRKRYRKLRDADQLSARQERELNKLATDIDASLTERTEQFGISDTQLKRLQAVQAQARRKKQS